MARGSRSRPAEKTAAGLCTRHARSRKGRSATTRLVISLASLYELLTPKTGLPHPLVPSSVRGNNTRAVLSLGARRRRHPEHGECISLDEKGRGGEVAHLHCTHEELFARPEPGEVQLQLRCRRLCASVFRQDRVGKANDVCQAVRIRLI